VTNDIEIISERDRTALLRQGIQVLAVRADETEVQVYVAGGDEDWARSMVIAQLGPTVDVRVCGAGPRELRPRRSVGHMEREAGRLQLRYVLVGDEHVDDIVVAEEDHSVVVSATICTPVAEAFGREVECPYHVYLDRPLGDRTVLDALDGEPVPYKNVYLDLKERYGLD
jgi:hypothetical protein